MTRKLAHIERIEEIIPIEGADLIVQYRVLGWTVVAKKGEFKVGELVCFFEPDSWIPNELAPFLTKPDKFPKVYNGIQGERLRTIKLRGALSQGLLLNIQVAYDFDPADYDHVFMEGDDITELLGIQKWEPEPEKIPTNAKGNFPSFIPKTDQERVQSCYRTLENYLERNPDARFVREEKAEGSSTTIFFYQGEFGVCSRNLQLKIDDPEVYQNSHFTKPAFVAGLKEKLETLGRNIAIQSEVIGPQVQSNYYGLIDWEYRVFDIFDIDAQKYLGPEEVYDFAHSMGLKTVPVIEKNVDLKGVTVLQFLNMAEGDSQIGNFKNLLREGDVWKSMVGERFTFKAVSPKYLILTGKG